MIRNSFIVGMVLSLDDALSFLPPPSDVVAIDASSNATIDGSNEGVVFLDARQASQASIAQWENAASIIAMRYANLEFFDQQKYLRVMRMPRSKRATILRRLRQKKEVPDGRPALAGLDQDDVEAVGSVLKLAGMIRKRRWTENSAVGPLIVELTAAGLM